MVDHLDRRRSPLLGVLMRMRPSREIRSIDARLVGFGLVVLLAVSVGVIARTGGHGQSITVVPRTALRGIRLASGHGNGVAWTFVVQAAADLPRAPAGLSGPCLGINTERLGSSFTRSSCGGRSPQPPVGVNFDYLDGDPTTMLFYGITSAPAATFRVDVDGASPVSTGALATKTFPGLRFYAMQLPAGSLPRSFPAQLSVTALASDGTPLLQSESLQMAPPPPPPASVVSAPPGTYPIWPAGGTATPPPYRTATTVARDFALRALGIPNPTVTEPGSVNSAGIGTVTIGLPARHHDLDVQVQRQPDGNWAITQVGDQRHLEGITMLPNGKPGPVMTIHPPAGAVTADVTEVAADGTHDLHLTVQDLQAGIAHLVAGGDPSATASRPIHTILIVYRDSANNVLDALGGEFG
jgi:hypothetical protein